MIKFELLLFSYEETEKQRVRNEFLNFIKAKSLDLIIKGLGLNVPAKGTINDKYVQVMFQLQRMNEEKRESIAGLEKEYRYTINQNTRVIRRLTLIDERREKKKRDNMDDMFEARLASTRELRKSIAGISPMPDSEAKYLKILQHTGMIPN